MPVRGVRHTRDDSEFDTFQFLNIFLSLCLLFSFRSSVAIYKYASVDIVTSPTFAGPLRSCFVKCHCHCFSFSRPRVRLGAVAEPAENPASCPSIRRSLLHVPRRIHMLLDRSPDVYRGTNTHRQPLILRFDFQTGVASFTRPRCKHPYWHHSVKQSTKS
jgi:hypothetical protein